MRRFEYRDEKSEKFWEISVDATSITARWGRIGTDGQSSTKPSSNPEADANKKIKSKLKKGYVEVKTEAAGEAQAISPDQVEQIRALIMGDRDAQKQGLEMARALGDWSAIIDGCTACNIDAGDARDLRQCWGDSDSGVTVGFGDKKTPTGALLELLFTNDAFAATVEAYASETKLFETDLVDLVGSCTNLRRLSLVHHGSPRTLGTVTQCQALEELVCINMDNLQHVQGLSNCRALRRIQFWECHSMIDFKGIGACPSLTTVSIREGEQWTRLDGLEACPALTTVVCDEVWLSDISALGKCKNLTTVIFSSCEDLSNIDALANCPNLTHVNVEGCQQVTNVDALAHCKMLKTLKLPRSVTDISALSHLVHLDRDSLSEAHRATLRPVSAEPKEDTRVVTVADIREMLLHADPEVQQEGLAKAKEMGELSAVLGRGGIASRGPQKGMINLPFAGGVQGMLPIDGRLGSRLNDALLELVLTAPGVDLSGLKRLNLSSSHVTHLDPLLGLPNLESLVLESCGSLKNLDGLKNCTKLRNLSCKGVTSALRAGTGLASLESVSGLANTQVTQLDLTECTLLESLDGLSALPLKRLNLEDCVRLKSLDGLRGLSTLESLKLVNCGIRDLSGLTEIPALEQLEVPLAIASENAAVLAKCPTLTALYLTEWTPEQDLGWLGKLPRITRVLMTRTTPSE